MRVRGTPWTTVQVKELRDLAKHMDVASLAAKYGVSKSCMYALFKKHGITPPRKRKWSAKEALGR